MKHTLVVIVGLAAALLTVPRTFAQSGVAPVNDAPNPYQTVENFFKLVEPSSPVALLLARARAYVGKDFAAILNELLPPPPSY